MKLSLHHVLTAVEWAKSMVALWAACNLPSVLEAVCVSNYKPTCHRSSAIPVEKLSMLPPLTGPSNRNWSQMAVGALKQSTASATGAVSVACMEDQKNWAPGLSKVGVSQLGKTKEPRCLWPHRITDVVCTDWESWLQDGHISPGTVRTGHDTHTQDVFLRQQGMTRGCNTARSKYWDARATHKTHTHAQVLKPAADSSSAKWLLVVGRGGQQFKEE